MTVSTRSGSRLQLLGLAHRGVVFLGGGHAVSLSRCLLALLAAAVLAPAAVQAAARDNPRFRFTAFDQRIARISLARKSEFGKAWTGGTTKPVLQGEPCGSYSQADLVVTGASSEHFASLDGAFDLYLSAWVMQTPQMVASDWKRLPISQLRGCVSLSYLAGDHRSTLVSEGAIPGFPRLSPMTRTVRLVYDFTESKGKTTREINDSVDVFVGRVELSFEFNAAYASRANLKEPRRHHRKDTLAARQAAEDPESLGVVRCALAARRPLVRVHEDPARSHQGRRHRQHRDGASPGSARHPDLPRRATLTGSALPGTGPRGGAAVSRSGRRQGEADAARRPRDLRGGEGTFEYPIMIGDEQDDTQPRLFTLEKPQTGSTISTPTSTPSEDRGIGSITSTTRRLAEPWGMMSPSFQSRFA